MRNESHNAGWEAQAFANVARVLGLEGAVKFLDDTFPLGEADFYATIIRGMKILGDNRYGFEGFVRAMVEDIFGVENGARVGGAC